MAPATSHDVARLAGVTQPTVSRALRDDPRISAETRRRIRDAAAALGYVPSRRGRSLATRSTGHIAVVVSDIDNPFYMEAVRHLHRHLGPDQRLILLTDPPGAQPAHAERLLDGSVDGAVLMTTLLDSSLPAELTRRGLPTVLFNRTIDAEVADACESENAEGAGLVAESLVALDHTAVAAIFGPSETSTGRDRERGFRRALAASGRPLDESRVRRGPFSHEAGHAAFVELMSHPDPPTAVFCANDVLALGALNAAQGLGLAVPADVTVVGFDDIAMAAWEVYRLSTIRQDLAEMARASLTMLEERIADPALPPRRIRLPTTLMLRGSHAPPRRPG